jgi:hypothetical protein
VSGLAIAVLFTVAPDLPRSGGPVPAPVPAGATVTLYGRAGTFGSVGSTTPSGQQVVLNAVPGWGFPPGVQAYRTTLAADGTVFVAGLGHHVDFTKPTADELVVAAYDPRVNRFSTIQLTTAEGAATGRAAPSIADLEPVAGGAAVAFTARPGRDGPQDQGGWPAFGILTKVDGQWQVARGPGGWTNQWTVGVLRAGTADAGLGEMAALPRSRDLIVTQDTGLLALRLAGPDAAGRYAVRVVGRYAYPMTVGDRTVAVREVQVDPTGRPGDERFTVGLDVASRATFTPRVIQEFTYDRRNGAIRPVSAPLIPGDRNREGTAFYGYGTFMYDDRGNLWVSRLDGFRGGKLAVYAAGAGRRKLAGGQCRYRPGRPLADYLTRAGGRIAWGQACRPDYDILQAQQLPGMQGLVQDLSTKDIVALAFGGVLMPVRATGTGSAMSFRIGNLLDIGRKLLPSYDGDWADHRLGGVDSAHRVWLTAMHGRPGHVGASLDQWLYSVDTTDLFAPAPVPVPDTPGQAVTIQAERSATVSAIRKRGTWATVDVDSDVFVHACLDLPATTTSCGYDGVAGNGFVLGDDYGFGHLRGTVEYRIDVPRAGAYRLSFRVGTFPVTKDARIALAAGGHVYTNKVSTGGSWRTVRAAETVALPAGAQTIALSVPPGGGGWFLNSFTLQRA